MKKILVILIGTVVLSLIFLPVSANCWIGDRQLEQINRRIDETEAKLLQLDQDQLINRLDWTNWGIDLLNRDIKAMEKEIQAKRQKWEEMRDTEMDSEQAWREWEKAGRELDELDRKRARLNATLGRLKRLRDRIQKRLREIKGIPEYKPFRLGLGIGSLNLNGSTQIAELKLRTQKLDLFYGGDGYEDEANRVNLHYYGVEYPLGIQTQSSVVVKFPIGVEKISTEEGIWPCIGIMGEFRYKNAKQEWTTVFGQIRYAIGKDSTLTFLIGIFF